MKGPKKCPKSALNQSDKIVSGCVQEHYKNRPLASGARDFHPIRAALLKSAIGEKQKSPEELDHAIRQIISRAVAPDQIVDIFAAAGLRKPDIPILSDEFLSEVKGMRQRNLAVDLLHKMVSNESKAQSKKFQIQSRSFSELLEATLRKYQNRAIETVQILEELIALAKEIREESKRGKQLHMSEDELAFCDALETNDSAIQALGDQISGSSPRS